MTSENTSSNTGRMRSERKRLTVLWPSGRMPVSHMRFTFSRVAAAILRLE